MNKADRLRALSDETPGIPITGCTFNAEPPLRNAIGPSNDYRRERFCAERDPCGDISMVGRLTKEQVRVFVKWILATDEKEDKW